VPPLEDRFKALSPEAIEELKVMPCLFAYEGKHDVRLGYLTAVNDRHNRVFIGYRFDERVPPIPFDKIEPLLPLLDVGDWEFSRTHWAIKDVDLLSTLAEDGVVDGSLAAGPLPASYLPPKEGWQLLGSGGFGSVYRVSDQRLGVEFALKVFDPHPFITSKENARERFLREAGLLFRLQHEHVIRVYDAGELPGGKPFIKMEYFAGSDLQRAAANCPLGESEALGLTLRLARALAHAHERGIVHRDIKPTNILVSQALDDLRLIDFGLGVLVEEAVARARLTTSSQQFGNAFAAPELLQDPKALHPEIDVYSLGAVWFWMHARRSPQGAGLDDSIADIGIDPALRHLLRRCLLPMGRRPSAADVASELASIIQPPTSLVPTPAVGAISARALPASAYLSDEEDVRSTLGLDEQWTVNGEWLTWARAQVTAAPGRHGEAARAVRLIATWLETHARESITEDDVMPMCRVVVGLDADTGDRTFDVESAVREALREAVKNGWLRHEEYDDWRPGMPSGSGMRDKYKLTPLGKKVLREAGYVPKPSEATATRERQY
jgi:serine/threonine-protein kinase